MNKVAHCGMIQCRLKRSEMTNGRQMSCKQEPSGSEGSSLDSDTSQGFIFSFSLLARELQHDVQVQKSGHPQEIFRCLKDRYDLNSTTAHPLPLLGQ